MANGSKSVVPATPAKSTRGPTEYSSTVASDLTSRLSVITERSVSFEESVDEDSDAKDEMMDYDDLEEKSSAAMQETDDQEDAMLSAGHSGVPRSLSRNLVEELDEVAEQDHAYDDYEDGTEGSKALVQVTKGPQVVQGNRPPMNGSTPAANKVLGRVFKQMMEESEWMQQFSPKSIRQAIWVELKGELTWPVNSINTTQVAEDTVSLLRAMGCEPQTHPSDAAIRDWPPAIAGRELQKWKRKLRLSFGTTDIGLAGQTKASAEQEEDDPSKVPLPQTPQKKPESSTRRQTTDGVFSVRTEGTPYFQDSHMVTPRSTSRAERISRTEGSKPTRSTQRGKTDRRFTPRSASSDEDDDEDDYLDHVDGRDSPSDELARQVREVSEMERLSSTPRLELATHRPLAQIKHFSGARNKSENSMQWLRAFVYEMKGTHTPPNEWCMAFELSLRDGALHWYRQLPRKTKRQWKLLSDAFIKYYCSQFKQSAKAGYYSAKRDGAEHICDYLNRLNGYARNAGLQFEKGGLDAKDHVHRFLESCGDRGLERRLCHVRVKDIHELEDMINDILKLEERGQPRETPAYPPRSRESTRRRDDKRPEASRDSYRRDDRRTDSSRDGYRRDRYDRRDRDFDRRRDDSRHVPRISLAEASLADMMTELQVRGSRGGRTERSSPRRHSYSSSESEAGNGLYSEDDQSGGDYSNDCNSEDEGGHVAAANDHERCAAAYGTYARSDHRQRKNGDFGRNVDRGNRNLGRDNREGRPRQYGPCAACGGLGHSAHYCYRRCKLCQQVHDVGKCEALQALTSLLRTKVEKKDLTPELQGLVFGGHLN
ncbi:Eukaryotic/viral aspartic protease [Phytophthora cinnamomi]|uniref:Eukaryotic/viral aspartic protease n=1 Tax=Phytophthora cinnamomi TaxID=4785 RepID=UPI00355982AD|nr:Eukaryotic/viral aspartic protease [Phytophthora cinnamomi]